MKNGAAISTKARGDLLLFPAYFKRPKRGSWIRIRKGIPSSTELCNVNSMLASFPPGMLKTCHENVSARWMSVWVCVRMCVSVRVCVCVPCFWANPIRSVPLFYTLSPDTSKDRCSTPITSVYPFFGHAQRWAIHMSYSIVVTYSKGAYHIVTTKVATLVQSIMIKYDKILGPFEHVSDVIFKIWKAKFPWSMP